MTSSRSTTPSTPSTPTPKSSSAYQGSLLLRHSVRRTTRFDHTCVVSQAPKDRWEDGEWEGGCEDHEPEDTSSLLDSTAVQQVATLFFGGPDDREAIAWTKRIASYQKINLTVIRFLSFESSRSRSERLDDRDDVVVFMSLASLETGKDIDNGDDDGADFGG